jgi:hypothetical protein
MPLDATKCLECSRAALLSEMSTEHKSATSPLKLCLGGCNPETFFCSLLQRRVFVRRYPQLVHPQEVRQKQLTSPRIASAALIVDQRLWVSRARGHWHTRRSTPEGKGKEVSVKDMSASEREQAAESPASSSLETSIVINVDFA